MRNQEERDLLTGLYGPKTGRWLVGEYLSKRDPYTSCGMLAVNIDDFRAINEEYGHFAGDQVLVVLAGFLYLLFRKAPTEEVKGNLRSVASSRAGD